MHANVQKLSANAGIIRKAAGIISLALRNHTPLNRAPFNTQQIPALVLLSTKHTRSSPPWPEITVNAGFKNEMPVSTEARSQAEIRDYAGVKECATPKMTKEQARGLQLLNEGWKQIAAYRGYVVDTNVDKHPNDVLVNFIEGENTLPRLFPKERLASIGAVFERAEVECKVYALGSERLSTLHYVGPPIKELLEVKTEELTSEELESLDDPDLPRR